MGDVKRENAAFGTGRGWLWMIGATLVLAACDPLRFPEDAAVDASDADAGARDAKGADATPDASDAGAPDLGVEDADVPDLGLDGGPRLQRLTVLPGGSGTGVVTSRPAGIDCGATCEHDFEQGLDVTLTATAARGSTFSGWSGAGCTGRGECTVRLDRDRVVSAAFERLRFPLHVELRGDGQGTITSIAPGIDCGTDCDETYDFDTMVTLVANVDGLSTFGGWSGDCTGTGPSCTVQMDKARNVVAAFDLHRYSLSVALGGLGRGRVTADVGTIDCPDLACTDSYLPSTTVTLTAEADALSRFDGWAGVGINCPGTAPCTVTMTQALALTAVFADVSQPLHVTKAGTGTGAVTSLPVGIACGTTCDARYLTGTQVTLIATPDPTNRFAGWTGACTGRAASCTVTLDTARTVTATFEEARALQVAMGLWHTCVLITPGALRCFGLASDGQLGYGDAVQRGDGVGPAANADDVPLALPAGVTISKVVAGRTHTCVLLSSGAVRCWGANNYGQLGYGDRTPRGSTAATIPPTDVPLGGAVADDIGAGDNHTCVKLSTGDVRCWGRGAFGMLGVGNTNDQLSADGANVAFAGGPRVEQLAVASIHACALLDTGHVRCWGRGLFGVLGLGDTLDRGDSPSSVPIAGDVPLGNITIQSIHARVSDSCVRTTAGAIRCWGNNGSGQLGRGNTSDVGDDAADNLALDVPVGAGVSSVSVAAHTCVKLATTGGLRCWGLNDHGQLGLGDTTNRGDGIGPSLTSGDVPLDAPFDEVIVSYGRTCVILTDGRLRCWGTNANGQLGYGDRIDHGNGTGPGPNVDVPIF